MTCARIRDDERGFTLIEVLMTILILLVGLAGAVTLTIGANAATSRTKAREAGTNLNRELVEAARGVEYAQLTPNGLRAAIEAQTQTNLADSTPATPTWTVERRGTTFTVSPEICSVDDGRDGYGDHSSGTFCPSTPAATNPPDDNSDDYKRVAFEIAWGGAAGAPVSSARQSTLVTNPSNSAGPRITSFTHDADLEMETSSSPITFTAEMESAAVSVRFAIDGTFSGSDTSGGTTAQFQWDVSDVVDGTYVVSATALNSAGLSGATRQASVRLNVSAPAAPTGVVGGWNATRAAVDVDWQKNAEADIVGYRVYRLPAGGSMQLACATGPEVTTCHDPSPPPAISYAYYVVALDESDTSGTEREGALSLPLAVVPTTFAPNPPATLQGSRVPGANQLDWTAAPPPAVPYTGSDILFYRLYRDGTEVARRHDFTGLGSDLRLTDDDIEVSHQYWVTAVDQNYSESVPIGPVTVP